MQPITAPTHASKRSSRRSSRRVRACASGQSSHRLATMQAQVDDAATIVRQHGGGGRWRALLLASLLVSLVAAVMVVPVAAQTCDACTFYENRDVSGYDCLALRYECPPDGCRVHLDVYDFFGLCIAADCEALWRGEVHCRRNILFCGTSWQLVVAATLLLLHSVWTAPKTGTAYLLWKKVYPSNNIWLAVLVCFLPCALAQTQIQLFNAVVYPVLIGSGAPATYACPSTTGAVRCTNGGVVTVVLGVCISRLTNACRDLNYQGEHSGNQLLSGSIPSEIGLMTSLEEMRLHNNQLRGSLPSEFGLLTSLVLLWLDHNQLGGSIPNEIGSLMSLKQLQLNNNQLNGSIPSEIGMLVSLEQLNLDTNQLSSSIPSEIGSSTLLKDLKLSNNLIRGIIPTEIGFLKALNSFLTTADSEIQFNQVSGSIPSEIGLLHSLGVLNLFFNELTGSIPREIVSLTSVVYFSLFNNQLNGSLPSEIGALISLRELWLHNNQFEGSIPSEIGSLPSLRYVQLYNNRLSGDVPNAINPDSVCGLYQYGELEHNCFTCNGNWVVSPSMKCGGSTLHSCPCPATPTSQTTKVVPVGTTGYAGGPTGTSGMPVMDPTAPSTEATTPPPTPPPTSSTSMSVQTVAATSTTSAAFSLIEFSGNVDKDFVASIVESVRDSASPDVSMDESLVLAGHFVSGYDIHSIRLLFDAGEDAVHIGIRCFGICGDADGDGDADSTSTALAALSGVDEVAFAASEAFAIAFDLNGDNLYDCVLGYPSHVHERTGGAYIGVGDDCDASLNTDCFGLYVFVSDIGDNATIANSFGWFDGMTSSELATVSVVDHNSAPTSDRPHLEWSVYNASVLIEVLVGVDFGGSLDGDEWLEVAVGVHAGSDSAMGVGNDNVPDLPAPSVDSSHTDTNLGPYFPLPKLVTLRRTLPTMSNGGDVATSTSVRATTGSNSTTSAPLTSFTLVKVSRVPPDFVDTVAFIALVGIVVFLVVLLCAVCAVCMILRSLRRRRQRQAEGGDKGAHRLKRVGHSTANRSRTAAMETSAHAHSPRSRGRSPESRSPRTRSPRTRSPRSASSRAPGRRQLPSPPVQSEQQEGLYEPLQLVPRTIMMSSQPRRAAPTPPPRYASPASRTRRSQAPGEGSLVHGELSRAMHAMAYKETSLVQREESPQVQYKETSLVQREEEAPPHCQVHAYKETSLVNDDQNQGMYYTLQLRGAE